MKDKKLFKGALFCSISLILLISIINRYEINQLITITSLISFMIYYFLFYFSLKAFRINKFLGLILFLSTFLLVPNLFNNDNGQLFPITYTLFISYFLLTLGQMMFKKWKKRTEL